MRKYKKKEMLEIVSSLIKNNESISKKCIKNKEYNAVDVLIECQNTAILLGNHLENIRGTGEELVHILEDYCENVYQMSLNTTNENALRKISKKIVKQLNILSNSIRYELPDDKKEIIFLPYKASMWDSLESVWKAATEEDNCTTYVIPIPYYDRNPDRTLGEMHYEGYEFPNYVPITSWEEYNIEEHRPDVAYIHNPYDDNNLITCIHPGFFAKELKKYVGILVYIPYFVVVNDKVDTHFCVTPVTIHADKIVVQSEPVRQTYIKELKKYEKDNYCESTFGKIEEKVLALGSPKYDKINNFCISEQLLPQRWKNIIYRSDGSRKKVILYNTSIQNILIYSEKMIDKISDSLKMFEAHKDDIALLWRPHPLLPITLQSMRPKLWNAYSAIMSQYQSAGWGIYDDTVDLDRAIAISDAYYGDGGSLLALYEKTGKSILVQNILVNNSTEDCKIPIWPCCFCVEDNTVWLVHGKMALLMEYDLLKQKMVKSVVISPQDVFQESMYSNIFQFEKKLYIIPCWAREVGLYNIETSEFNSEKLKDIEQFEEKILFCKSFRNGNSIYCIPKEYAYIVRIHLGATLFEYIDLREKLNIDKINITDATITGKFIFCTYNYSNKIIQYNMNTSKVELLTIGEQRQQYIYIRWYENKIYLFDRFNHRMEIRDEAYQLIKSIDNLPFKGFGFSIISSDMMLLDDAYSENIICINEQGENLDVGNPECRNVQKKSLDYGYYHGLVEKFDGKQYYFDRNKYKLYELSGKEKVATYAFSYSKETGLFFELIKESLQHKSSEENELFNLNVWLEHKTFYMKQNGCEENNGKRISQIIMGEVNHASSVL